jgi:hypothetical protein
VPSGILTSSQQGMLEPFVDTICFPQTWQSAVRETALSCVISYSAPQWGHFKVSAI